jgi:hypothetical protein
MYHGTMQFYLYIVKALTSYNYPDQLTVTLPHLFLSASKQVVSKKRKRTENSPRGCRKVPKQCR